MPSELVLKCSRIMAERKLTIAFVESATAGRLSAEFSLVPESGRILTGGLVCYDAAMKEDILGIPRQILQQYTPESAEVSRELAERFQSFIKSDIYVAVTGLVSAGGSETPQKPVGTMFIHILAGNRHFAIRQIFLGPPEDIILQAIDKAAEVIIAAMETSPSAVPV